MSLAASVTLAAAVLAAEFPAAIRVMPDMPARVELTNTGTQPITAWSFTVSTPTANGVHNETHTADVYLSQVTENLPGAAPHLNRIMPGQSRSLPIDATGPGTNAIVTALILQDGTALGDTGTLDAFFAHRARERDQLHAVSEAFRTSLAAKRGMAALTDVKQQLQSLADGESVPAQTARQAVETFLQKARAGNEDEADRSAHAYADFVAKQYDVAAAQAQRKTSATKFW